ncbi:MAG: hypothetical protein NUW37_18350 [Planctomycetes bacterium]|nr:hypothetical protein [Planctomycetota bacterium]
MIRSFMLYTIILGILAGAGVLGFIYRDKIFGGEPKENDPNNPSAIATSPILVSSGEEGRGVSSAREVETVAPSVDTPRTTAANSNPGSAPATGVPSAAPEATASAPAQAQSAAPVISEENVSKAQGALAQIRELISKMQYDEAKKQADEFRKLPGLSEGVRAELDIEYSRASTFESILSGVEPFEPDYSNWMRFNILGGGSIMGQVNPDEIRSAQQNRIFVRVSSGGGGYVYRDKLRTPPSQMAKEDVLQIYLSRLQSRERDFNNRSSPTAAQTYRWAETILRHRKVLEDLKETTRDGSREYDHFISTVGNLLEMSYQADPHLRDTALLESSPEWQQYLYLRSMGQFDNAENYRLRLFRLYPNAQQLTEIEAIIRLERQTREETRLQNPPPVTVSEPGAVTAAPAIPEPEQPAESITHEELTTIIDEEMENVRTVDARDLKSEEQQAEESQRLAGGGLTELMRQARQYYDEGLAFERAASPGARNEVENLQLAISSYRRAQQLLNQANERYPEREAEYSDQYSKICTALFWCRKRLPI